jgi:hypothetical protein
MNCGVLARPGRVGRPAGVEPAYLGVPTSRFFTRATNSRHARRSKRRTGPRASPEFRIATAPALNATSAHAPPSQKLLRRHFTASATARLNVHSLRVTLIVRMVAAWPYVKHGQSASVNQRFPSGVAGGIVVPGVSPGTAEGPATSAGPSVRETRAAPSHGVIVFPSLHSADKFMPLIL